jgi:hypothetical protein
VEFTSVTFLSVFGWLRELVTEASPSWDDAFKKVDFLPEAVEPARILFTFFIGVFSLNLLKKRLEV